MNRYRCRAIAAGLLILFATISSLIAQFSPWKGTITTEGGVTVAKNPKEPIHKEPILSLKEDFAISGAGATGDYAFSYPRDIAVDKDGNIYVLDMRECCIKVFDPSAKHLRTIGRRGQGPGELGGPFSLTLLSDKGEIFVNDISRISVFNTTGSYLRQMPARGLIDQIKIDTQGNIYVSVTEFGQGGPQDILKKMNPDMSRILAELVRHPESTTHNPFQPRDRWILDGQDRLIYGDGKTYEIRTFSPEGKLVRRILRDYELLKVSQKDIEEFGDRRIPGSGAKVNYEFSTHHAAYRSFFADDQGHLFVQTLERTADRLQDIHDIFDTDGRYIGRVALSRHADLINPKPRLIRAGKLYTIEPDKEGYEVVKRYTVEWLTE